jgi:hypothetical protein
MKGDERHISYHLPEVLEENPCSLSFKISISMVYLDGGDKKAEKYPRITNGKSLTTVL